MSPLLLVFRLLLRAFPRAWRQEYGREMEEIFLHCVQVERGRRQGLRRHLAPWRGLADAVAFGYGLRREDAGPRIRGGVRQRGALFMMRDDVRSAFRLLRKEPLFAATLVATLALGIGAATAMATIANAVLVRALPLPDSDRLYIVRVEAASATTPDDWFPLSDADFLAWRDQNRAMTAVSAWSTNDYTLTGRGDPEPLRGINVTTRFFDVVGVRPAVGRVFEPADTAPVVILSDQLWTRTFARDPAIVGQTIALNGRTATVVGVMPPDFTYPRRRTDVWVHRRFDSAARRGPFHMTGLGRLRDGATALDVTADLDRAAASVKEAVGRRTEVALRRRVPEGTSHSSSAARALHAALGRRLSAADCRHQRRESVARARHQASS
jgi:putative ABC transport system permease protein